MNLRRGAVAGSCLALFVVLGPARSAVADNLCPTPQPPMAVGDRRIKETDLNEKRFVQALRYLEEDLPRALLDKATTEDVRNSESYMIGYPNVITSIKGYVLRQDALLRLAERDVVVEKSQRGRASKTDVTAADARFQEAKRRFCDFLKDALYAD